MTLSPRSKTDRLGARSQVIPNEIRGLISRKTPGANGNLPFLIWDVSPSGIGLWTAEELSIGETVVLTVGQPFLVVLTARVVWCESMSDHQGYRCGMEAVDDAKSLETLVRAFEAPPAVLTVVP